jgi:hypothetical protein
MPKKANKYFSSNGFLIRSLPLLMSNSKSLAEWRKISDEVAALYPSKSEKSGATPFLGKYEAFKRAVYQIGLHCSSDKNARQLKAMAITENKPSLGHPGVRRILEESPDTETNLFHYVYYLLDDSQNKISRMEKRRGIAQLAYAMMHNVPPEYLTGFIAQSGGDLTVLSKLNADKREPWYKWRQQRGEQ